MAPMTPYWKLEEVRALVTAGAVFIYQNRAVRFFVNYSACHVAVEEIVEGLTEESFVETIQQKDICDVYGVEWEGQGWYLKFCIDESQPELLVISLHPLEHPIKTKAGTVYP